MDREGAWDFLQRAWEFQSLDELQDEFARILEPLGFDQFSCTLVAHPTDSRLPRVLFGRSNQAWDRYYFEQGFLRIDPCVRWLFRPAAGPFLWSDVTTAAPLSTPARDMFAQAAEAGAREGYVALVLGGVGETYAVRLVGGAAEVDAKLRPVLHALCVVYATTGVKLLELSEDSTTHTPLSRREMECLRWVSEGKSDWDIAEILSISEGTVHAHVERAKQKLGVRTRVQAVVIATLRGWFSVNSPD
jgi:DNA-binding CsgD family transcriptional regulator